MIDPVRLRRWARLAVSLPPRELARKAAGKLRRSVERRRGRRRDLATATYQSLRTYEAVRLAQRMPAPRLEVLRGDAAWLAGVGDQYLAHRFDLLGSGWTEVRHGRAPDPAGAWLADRVTPANLPEARRVWQLIDPGYAPIDWHLDWKSGFRWPERRWYQDVAYGQRPGVDVKLPWELSRMQHLPQLALAHALATAGTPGFAPAARYVREVRNEILDFIATNPPRFGVNWAMPMDVGIRLGNWLIARDLLLAAGAPLDDAFEAVLARSVYEHGRHLVENLEWTAELRGNHYLADITGLLFAAAYLPRSAETDRWLALAVQELTAEVATQFLPDGANFEASTSYHRLSAEMVVYATALVLGLPADRLEALRTHDGALRVWGPVLRPDPVPLHPLGDGDRRSPFPSWYFERIRGMAAFTRAISKADGRIPQIGDNDSGRFLKLWAPYERIAVAAARARYADLDGYDALSDDAEYWDEITLDHRHLVAAIGGLFADQDWRTFAGDAALEAELVRGLAGGRPLPPSVAPQSPVPCAGRRDALAEARRCLAALPASRRRSLRIDIAGGSLREGMTTLAFPSFGLYLFRSRRLYLAVRCGPIGQNGVGGHAHNDQLALELAVDGTDWIADPGSYLYTPDLRSRNAYRSAAAHFAPRLAGGEPGRLDLGPFQLGGETSAECLYFGPEGFVGGTRGPAGTLHAVVTVADDRVHLTYGAEAGELGEPPAMTELPFSPGYGKRWRAPLRPPAMPWIEDAGER